MTHSDVKEVTSKYMQWKNIPSSSEIKILPVRFLSYSPKQFVGFIKRLFFENMSTSELFFPSTKAIAYKIWGIILNLPPKKKGLVQLVNDYSLTNQL